MFKLIIKYLTICVTLLIVPVLQAKKPLLDLVDVKGVRTNQLIGYGLVVGLDGTGDKSQVEFTSQSIINMLNQFGVQLPDRIDPKLKNVAAVTVTAKINAMQQPGQEVDVVVSSLGDAKSLRGGTLLLTPLRGVDGEVYAIAQGNVVISGIQAEGRSGTRVVINTPTSGRIPNGATIEKEVRSDFNDSNVITLNLKRPSFTTSKNISRAINNIFGPDVSRSINKNTIEVRAPRDSQQRVTFMSMLEEIQVDEGAVPAKIIFNSRTGTVVIGRSVTVSEAAVSHGSIKVSITENQQVSQPNAFSDGETTVVDNSDVDIQQGDGRMFLWRSGVNLQEIVNAINSIGASPDDLMAILQALKEAGAINAEIIVI